MNLFVFFLYLPVIYLSGLLLDLTANPKERYFNIAMLFVYYLVTFLVKLSVVRLKVTPAKPGLPGRVFLANVAQIGFVYLIILSGKITPFKGVLDDLVLVVTLLVAAFIQVWVESFLLKGFFEPELFPKLKSALWTAFILNYFVINFIFMATSWYLMILIFGFDVL